MHIHSYPNVSDVLHHATDKLNSCLEKYAQQPVLLLLSGGSALQLIDGIEAKNVTRHMTVTVLDERYSRDENVNNFAQIARTGFYRMVTEHGAQVIDTRIHHNESQADLAKRFEKELRGWREEFPNGKIVASLGMGKDGHISGIMPYAREVQEFEKLFLSQKWVSSYDAKNKNPFPKRVTTTLTFLKQIDCAVMYVTGDSKKESLDAVVREKGKLHTYPSRIIHEMKDVHLFTDQT